MKTLIALLLLTACVKEEIEVTLKSKHTFCKHLEREGYSISADKCDNHHYHPKFKSGSHLKIIDSNYADNCRFDPTVALWVGSLDKPAYLGTVRCKNLNNEYIIYRTGQIFLEENLKSLDKQG